MRIFLSAVLALAVTGCSTTKQSNTARTAREQLLISNAVDQALSKVDFAPFRGNRVFIEDKYLDCVDKGYVIGSIRHRAMLNGATVVPKAEEADLVLEARSGGLGTDLSDSFIGSPEIVLPGMITLPEVRLVTKTRQSAMAKIGLVAYDPKTHQVLGQGGVSSSISDDNNWYVLGVGPYQDGSIRNELEHAVPMRASQSYQQMPVSVAFRSPAPVSREEAPGRLQLTSESAEATEATK